MQPNENEKLPETTLETGKTGYEKEKEEAIARQKYVVFPEGDTIVIPQAELFDLPIVLAEFDNGQKKEQKELPVLLEDGTIKPWGISLGGKKSNYGRLLNIGLTKGNLKGRKIRVTRQGLTKDETTYTIVEVK